MSTATPTTNLLEMRNVSQIFGDPAQGGTVALDDLTFSIASDKPTFTSVVGESGSGKTTLARILLGFQNPTKGQVLYQGQNLADLKGQSLRHFRREVQAIFQDPFEVYNPFYKIDHLLDVPIKKFKLASSRKEARVLMEEALSAVGLRPDETLGRFPHQLSGGQRQRITVARAMLLKPRVIIADEPVSMVDASLRATILETLRKLHEDLGISMLYITHDLTTAYQVSDNILVLYKGRVAEVGDVVPVIKQPTHPYTQLLVSSIPLPDPNRRWGENVVEAVVDDRPASRVGCAFAPRCPHAMPICTEAPPPLYRTEDYRAASCYLPATHHGTTDVAQSTLPVVTGDITQTFPPARPATTPVG
ncbi:MAG: ABC transporter ATP-binding protein [Thermomicrobiales bacterium]